MNEQDLRDCFAMFALNGMLASGTNDEAPYRVIATSAYALADEMLEARTPKEVGIKTVKRTRKTNDEEN